LGSDWKYTTRSACKGFPEDTESWEILYGFESSKELKEGIAMRDHRGTSSMERNTLVSCAEILRGKNEWSELFKEN